MSLDQLFMSWDPFTSSKQSDQALPPICLARIKRDLVAIYKNPPPGIHVVADETDMTLVHCLVIGAEGTPYEGGFFYFVVRFPPNYPISPPMVKMMTTGGGRVRFNPNLYSNGKVCLSILGTWSGPGWSPAQSLASVLISIQSLMNEKPYHNEPGYERERHPGDADRYNQFIQHETLRVAVVGMLDNDDSIHLPQQLREVMEAHFFDNYESYEDLLNSRRRLHGKRIRDDFSYSNKMSDYITICSRLKAIQERLASKRASMNLREMLKL